MSNTNVKREKMKAVPEEIAKPDTAGRASVIANVKDGTKLNPSVGYKNIHLLEMRKNILIEERRKAVPPTGKPVGFPLNIYD